MVAVWPYMGRLLAKLVISAMVKQISLTTAKLGASVSVTNNINPGETRHISHSETNIIS